MSKNILEDYYNKIPVVKERKKRRLHIRILRYVGLFLFFSALFLVIYFLFHFYTLKAIYNNLNTGRKEIQHSANLIKEKDFNTAELYAKEARGKFLKAGDLLISLEKDPLISNLPFIKDQVDDLHYLASTAEVLSATAITVSRTGAEIKLEIGDDNLPFSELPTRRKRAILSILQKSTPELNGIGANIKLAIENIGKIKFRGVLFPVKNKLGELNNYLIEADKFLDSAVPLTQLFPSLLGFPEKSVFLFILQNKDELRPTGGFIGTYGILEMSDGDILRFDTHDIYHMDMPVKDLLNVEPPEPLRKYLGVEKWFMRDANWSPDWPTASEKIKWFYKKEDALLPPQNKINDFEGEFDGVIGITADLVEDFLKLIGPIKVEHNTYTHENFSELLEYRVEKEYIQLGVPSWERKEVIGEIVKEIKIRVLSKSLPELLEYYYLLIENLQKKNVIVNLSEAEFQKIISENNWSGETRDYNIDYLMVVDANMAALKTDLVIDRKIEYNLISTLDGLYADLNIHYSHNGNFDWRTTRYRTYTRVYVPLGSELIQTQKYEDGIDIGEEYGKTYFGAFISLEPQSVKSVNFYYKLPDSVDDAVEEGEYELLIQKQPGNNTQFLNVNLEFDKAIRYYHPFGFFTEKSNDFEIEWRDDLKVDKIFEIKF